MSLRSLSCWASALAIAHALLLSEAQALWTITTYLSKLGGEITSTRIADQYLRGELPTRFTAMGTVPEVDLFENGGIGQFMIDHAFPGIDFNEADGSTSDFATQVTGTLLVNTAGSYDFFHRHRRWQPAPHRPGSRRHVRGYGEPERVGCSGWWIAGRRHAGAVAGLHFGHGRV